MGDIEFLLKRPIAHRGLHDLSSPENSLAAFQKAIDLGYPVELDVQASLEGIPVVFHDRLLDRLTALEGPVSHQTLETLEKTPLLDSDQTIASLDTVLSLIAGQVPLLIEIKSDTPYVSLTKAVVEVLKDYQGRYTLQSFDPRVVNLIKKMNPAIIRGQISELFTETSFRWIKKWALSRMIRNPWTKPDYIVYAVEHLDKPWVKKARLKRPLIAYTLRSKKAAEAALNHADNVIFEGFSWD